MTTAKKKKKGPATMRITYQTTLAIQQEIEIDDASEIIADPVHQELIRRVVAVVQHMQNEYPDRKFEGNLNECVFASGAVVL